MLVLFLLVLPASGCVQEKGNETNETTTYEYYNVTNETPSIREGKFFFKIHGPGEYWFKPGDIYVIYAVFNNEDEDNQSHNFIARALPSAADFDVHAAYKCMHFTECEELKNDMQSLIVHDTRGVQLNNGGIGISEMQAVIPNGTVKGTYLYDVIACEDIPFHDCDLSTSNWGPVIPLTIHIL